MKKFLVQIALFVGIGIVLLNLVGWALDWHYGKLNNKYIKHKANWVFKKSGESYDYAVLGSSRAFNVVDINTIDSISGLSGINLGSGGAAYSQCYVLLEMFLRKNEIKSLLLCLDYPSLNSDISYSYPFSDYAFLPQFEDDVVEEAFYDEVPLHKYFMYKFIKGSKYIEFNEKYPSYKNFLKVGKEENYEKLEKSMGTSLVDSSQLRDSAQNITGRINPNFSVNPTDEKYLMKILSLCKRNNIRVAAYSAPYVRSFYLNKGYPAVQQKIGRYTDSIGLLWKDFTSSPLAAENSLFADKSHLNSRGAKLFARELAPLILELVESRSAIKTE